ncbi:MAG: MerR family transcriptional regulator [Acidimicrobiales bacterium]
MRHAEEPYLTVDGLAAWAGTTVRHVRALQTAGLVPGPVLRGRTGLYGEEHRRRLGAVLRLQEEGFSLAALRVLLVAWEEGRTLDEVLGLPPRPRQAVGEERAGEDPFEGFAPQRGRRGSLLTVVPSTVLGAGVAGPVDSVAS